jgi:pimeloyl-ACP methyl ester carboxylesterase
MLFRESRYAKYFLLNLELISFIQINVMRTLKIFGILVVLVVTVYLLGPHPQKANLNSDLPVIASVNNLDSLVLAGESLHKIKPNNEAKIIWADSNHLQTEYAIVYLHGFSASQMEGAPVHENIAKAFHCNLYLARLAEHGIDTTEDLMNLTAENYWESAKWAYAIGKQLGKKVILMSTSTGGTLSLALAATYPEIAGLIMYSPNIEINNPAAFLLNDPWGLQIARFVKGGNYANVAFKNSEYPKYWNTNYRLESTIALQNLLEASMTPENFAKINQPVLALYYYKDEQHQDPVVKVSAIQKMLTQISTPKELKKGIAIPNAESHVLASPIVSKDILSVEAATKAFMEQIYFKKN